MKENKTEIVKVRITPTEKENLKQYAEKREITMSEAIRELCYLALK